MFDFVRSHNRVLQVMLGIVIIPVFGFVGLQSYLQPNEAAVPVASVDGHDISHAEWDNQRRIDIDQVRARNPQADLKLLDTPAAQRQSLDKIVRDRVLLAAVNHENLGVSDERIAREYQTNPEFEQLRALPKATRDAVLAQQGMSGNAFLQNIGQQIARAQAQQGVAMSGFLPASALKAGADAWFDQRDIQWQRFDVKDYAAKITPSDADVEAYYKAHAADFVAPEQAKIEYLVFEPAALQAQVKADPTLVQGYYDANKSRYTTPEERSASYILAKVAPNASAADVAKAKALAESELAEVRKNPAGFAEFAKKIPQDGGPLEGGDLDFMRKGALGVPALDDVLFSMKPDQISDVIRIDGGFQIVKLTGVRGGAVKSFDEVKPQIEDQLKAQEASKRFAADADKFKDTVYEQADSLDAAAKAFQLTKQTATVTRKPAAGATGALASPKLLAAVFASDAIKNKHNTEAVETGPNQLAAAHVVEYAPQHTRPLAEVRDLVVAAVRNAQAAAAAQKDGQARVAEARKDPALALPQTATVSRLDRSGAIPRPIVEAVLKADLSKGPQVEGLALPDGSYAVMRVLKSTPHVPDANESAQFKDVLTQAFEEAEAEAVYDSLKARYKVKYNDDRIAKFTSQAASAAN